MFNFSLIHPKEKPNFLLSIFTMKKKEAKTRKGANRKFTIVCWNLWGVSSFLLLCFFFHSLYLSIKCNILFRIANHIIYIHVLDSMHIVMTKLVIVFGSSIAIASIAKEKTESIEICIFHRCFDQRNNIVRANVFFSFANMYFE